MKCQFCDYEWKPRVPKPVSCPRCKRRFDYPFKKDRRNGLIKSRISQGMQKGNSGNGVRKRPISHEELINSIRYIKARDKYLQEAGILTQTGPRRWRLKIVK